MTAINQLIAKAVEGGDAERELKFILKAEIRTFGKEDQCWKVIKKVIQTCKVQGLDVRFFLLNGEEITDTSDGSTEHEDALMPSFPHNWMKENHL